EFRRVLFRSAQVALDRQERLGQRHRLGEARALDPVAWLGRDTARILEYGRNVAVAARRADRDRAHAITRSSAPSPCIAGVPGRGARTRTALFTCARIRSSAPCFMARSEERRVGH